MDLLIPIYPIFYLLKGDCMSRYFLAFEPTWSSELKARHVGVFRMNLWFSETRSS